MTSGKIYASALMSFNKNGTARYCGLSLIDTTDATPERAFMGAAQGQGEYLALASHGASPVVSGQTFWGGSEKEIEIRKANDVFAAYAGRGRAMPQKARIIRASCQVKFTDSKTARTVTIRPSNIAQYTRDSDAAVVEDWLTKRGFILAEQEDDEE